MTAAGPANQLAQESSPYLRQHARNPVHWRPWGPEALAEARRSDRPIHLSIGYSACHWCHVMAHESFEDPAVAELLNERFVNVKVDREEHPELDHVYQLAHQLLTGRGGGWPLTMFLTPDGRPFFGGTYFPPTPRHGLPAFPTVLLAVTDHYTRRRTDVDRAGEELTRALALAETAGGGAGDRVPGEAPLRTARAALQRDADPEHGGFGDAPKFPRPGDLERLLRHHDRHPDDQDAPRFLRTTLLAMADRGLNDHLAGGFHRYCVDARWDIPHFEKMLYDNAQLLGVYADAWAAYGEPRFRRVAEQTADWMLRELRHPLGGFFSTLDADSGEGEGAYYVWGETELREVLGEADLEWARAAYGLSGGGNFEGRHHLHRAAGAEDLARRFGVTREAAEERLERIRGRLLAARERRPRPGRDEKILASWNGLAIRALARAGRLLDRPDWVEAADRAAGFLRRTLWRDGRLGAVWTDGRARFAGRLDDHAYLLDGLLELLQARWNDDHLRWAGALADQLLDRFEDGDAGGFFLTAHDDEPLIHRPKPAADGATPSGNGVAARALLRLGCLVGDPRYLEAAERTLRAFARTIERLPPAHGALLDALEEHLSPGPVVILRGRPEDLAACCDVCRRGYHPRRASFLIPPEADLPEALAHKRPLGTHTAYVCAGTRCSPPISTPEALREALARC